MPYIRLTILTLLTPIFIFSLYEYVENGKFDYYKATKDNKETMLDILYLSKELDQYKDLYYCSDLKINYKHTYQIYNQNFLETIFIKLGTALKYNKKYTVNYNYEMGYVYKYIDILYNNDDDFSFCLRKEYYKKPYKSNFFKYLNPNLNILSYEKCEGGYNLGKNRMFKIEDDKFIYCEN